MTPPDRTADQLHPDVERELEAVDRALAGEPVESELAELATLTADLRAERPEPDPDWSAATDRRIAAELERRSPADALAGLLRRRPRRLFPAVGAAAGLLAVVAIGIGTLREGGEDALETGAPSSEDPAVLEERGTAPPSGTSPEDSAGAIEPAPGPDAGAGQAGPSARDSAVAPPIVPGVPGPTAPGADRRRQDRSATLALKTPTEQVREVSDRAIQITESAGGVVLSSRLVEEDMRATAELQLSIPTRELDSTLDQLTDLATVESLSEAAVDITGPFVSARQRLRDARAERAELLEALGNVSSEQEAEALRRQLRQARRKIARAKASFDNVARRARFSDVRLTVAGSPGEGDDRWGLGDAADDAVDALETVGGVLLVALAILAPLGLIVAVAALITARLRHRRRERALDE